MAFSDDWNERADYALLQYGAVNLFWRKPIFEESIAELKQLNYRIVKIQYTTMSTFREELSLGLNWENRFGYHPWNGNLDALNDGFFPRAATNESSTAICIEDYNLLYKEDNKLGFTLLDIIETNSRRWLLFGHRLLALIQTNDEKFKCEGIGANIAHWNRKEWFDDRSGY